MTVKPVLVLAMFTYRVLYIFYAASCIAFIETADVSCFVHLADAEYCSDVKQYCTVEGSGCNLVWISPVPGDTREFHSNPVSATASASVYTLIRWTSTVFNDNSSFCYFLLYLILWSTLCIDIFIGTEVSVISQLRCVVLFLAILLYFDIFVADVK